MGETEKEVKIFDFYGRDANAADKMAHKMRSSGQYHSVWYESDTRQPDGYGWYVKYIEK